MFCLLFLLVCSHAWLSCKDQPSGVSQLAQGVHVYCDGHGRALIQKSQVLSQCSTYTAADGLTPSVCGYVSEPTVRALATLSTTLHLSDEGETIRNTDSCALNALRGSTNWQYASCSWNGSWRFQYRPEHFACGGVILEGAMWPEMFHGCGMGSGVHWLPTQRHASNNAVSGHKSTDSSTYLVMVAPCGVNTVGFPSSGCRACTTNADCNGHATSVTDDGFRDKCVCSCTTGWSGATCNTRGVCTIPLDCDPQYTTAVSGNHPFCRCMCIPRYSGPNCSTPDICTNSQDCSSHASSVAGTFPSCACTCHPWYIGAACDTRICHKAVDCIDTRTRVVAGTYPLCECNCVLGYGGATCRRTLTESRSLMSTLTTLVSASRTSTSTMDGSKSISRTFTNTFSPSISRSILRSVSATSTISLSPSCSISFSLSPTFTLTETLTTTASLTASSSPTPSESNPISSMSESSASLSASACLGIAAPIASLPLGDGTHLPLGIAPMVDCDVPAKAVGAGTFYLPRRMSRNGRPLCLMLSNVPISWHLHLPYPPKTESEVVLEIDIKLQNMSASSNDTSHPTAEYSLPFNTSVKQFRLSKAMTGTLQVNSSSTYGSNINDNDTTISSTSRWIPLGTQSYHTIIYVACAALHDPLELVLQYEPTPVTALDTISTAVAVFSVLLGGDAAMGSTIPMMSALTCDNGETVAPVSRFAMLMVSFFYDVSEVAVVFGNVAVGIVVLAVGGVAVLFQWKLTALVTAPPLKGSETLSKSTSKTPLEAILPSCGECRCPSWPMKSFEFLMPGVMFGSILLFVSPTSTPGEYASAVIGVCLCAAFPLLYQVTTKCFVLPRASWYEWPDPSVDTHPAYGRHRLLLQIFPEHQWRTRELRLAFNPLMGSMEPSTAATWRPVEVALSFAPAIGAGVSAGGQAVLPYSCVGVGYTIAVVYLSFAVMLCFARPYRLPLDTVLCPILYAILGISLLIKMTSSALAMRVTGNEAMEVALGLSAAILQVLQVAVQLARASMTLYITWLEGRVPQVSPDALLEMEEELQIKDEEEPFVEDHSLLDRCAGIPSTGDNESTERHDDILDEQMLDTLLQYLDAEEHGDTSAVPVSDDFLVCPLPTGAAEDERSDEAGSFFGIHDYFSSLAIRVVESARHSKQR